MTKNTKYVSETTEFLQEFINKHPEVKKKQKILRKTFWDKDESEVEEDRKYIKNEVKLDGYAYFSYKNTK